MQWDASSNIEGNRNIEELQDFAGDGRRGVDVVFDTLCILKCVIEQALQIA